MSISRAKVESALKQHQDPYLHRDYAQLIQSVDIQGDHVKVVLAMPYPHASLASEIQQKLSQAIIKAGAKAVDCQLVLEVPRAKPQQGLEGVPPIKNVIVVASGKGGVGKSTTAVNIALALLQEGARVGVLDADIYGPSQPMMLGLSGQTPKIEDNAFVPLETKEGLQVMSVGFLTGDETTPIVWRGPKATGMLTQLFSQSAWHDLDYLIVDMPPGTGDIQLTLAQRIPVVGSVIVTTPQDIALLDAKKGIEMFRKVNIRVLGVVENMSLHICSNCGHADEIFGAGGGERIAKDYQTDLLGQLPLERSIREQTDSGKPTVLAEPHGKIAAIYVDIARKVAAKLALEDSVPRNRIMAFFGK